MSSYQAADEEGAAPPMVTERLIPAGTRDRNHSSSTGGSSMQTIENDSLLQTSPRPDGSSINYNYSSSTEGSRSLRSQSLPPQEDPKNGQHLRPQRPRGQSDTLSSTPTRLKVFRVPPPTPASVSNDSQHSQQSHSFRTAQSPTASTFLSSYHPGGSAPSSNVSDNYSRLEDAFHSTGGNNAVENDEGELTDDAVAQIASEIGAHPDDVYRMMRGDDAEAQERLMEQVRNYKSKDSGYYGKGQAVQVGVDFQEEEFDGSEASDATEMVHSSRSFRSNLSTHTLLRSSRPRTPRNNAGAGGRKVQFQGVAVNSVVVYEVDHQLYLAIEYSTHWAAWFALFVGLAFSVIFNVHVCWFLFNEGFLNDGKEKLKMVAIDFWISLCHAGWCVLLITCCYLIGIGNRPTLRFAKSTRGIMMLVGMALGSSGGYALETISVQYSKSVHFFSMMNLHSVWILLVRMLIHDHIFFWEVIGVVVATSGFIVASIPTYHDFTESHGTVGFAVVCNVVLFVASLCIAVFFFALQAIRFRVNLPVLVSAPAVMSTLMGFLIAVGWNVPLSSSAEGVFGLFKQDYFMHASIMALEHLLSIIGYFLAVRYLDILSVSACTTLTTVLCPLFNRLLVFDQLPEAPRFVQDQWGPTFFAGVGIVSIGTVFVVLFSSVKRQFVARRLAIERRRPVANPYIGNSVPIRDDALPAAVAAGTGDSDEPYDSLSPPSDKSLGSQPRNGVRHQ